MKYVLECLEGKDLAQVEQQTGVKKSWLYQFRRGHIDNPGVNTIQKLYEHFSGKALEV